VKADEEGTLHLVVSINRAMKARVADSVVESVCKRMWGDLKAELDKVPPAAPGPVAPVRTERELIEEILTRVRDLDLDSGFVGPGIRLTTLGGPLGTFGSQNARPVAGLGTTAGAMTYEITAEGVRATSGVITAEQARAMSGDVITAEQARRMSNSVITADDVRSSVVIPEKPTVTKT
jgi:hypothetical protein